MVVSMAARPSVQDFNLLFQLPDSTTPMVFLGLDCLLNFLRTHSRVLLQWSNYQKISKGAHTIVNANEAMLLITGGSRTSESGDKFFPKFFLPLFTGVSENLFAF